MPNYDYANSAGLTALSERTFEKIKKEITTDVVTSEAENPLVIETAAAQTAKSTIVKIEPIQDLRGYDHPWPAGGGKNLLPLTVSNVKSRNTDGTWNGNAYTYRGITFTLNANEDGSITSIVANGTANNNNANLYLYPATQSQNFPFGGMILSGCVYGGAYIRIELVNSPYTSYATATGSESIIDSAVSQQGTATINVFARVVAGETVSNAVFKPMIRLASVSDATFAPYSNICPISGLDEVKVERTGKNLVSYVLTANISGDGEIVSQPYKMPVAPVKKGKTYTVTTDENGFVGGFFTQKPAIGSVSYNNTRIIGEKTFTAPIDGYVVFRATSSYETPQMELGSAATAYEPYTSSEVSVDLPTTIYGGTLNLETRELVADMGMVDLGTLTWYMLSNHEGTFYGELPSYSVKNTYNAICSKYTRASATNGSDINNATSDKVYAIAPSSITNKLNDVFIRDSAYTDAATFKTAMNGVQLAYELATPIIYHLTPAQLDLLKGTNVLTVNGKTIQVTYREGLLATLEELNAVSFDLSNVKSKLPPIIIKDGMLQVTYDDGQ